MLTLILNVISHLIKAYGFNGLRFFKFFVFSLVCTPFFHTGVSSQPLKLFLQDGGGFEHLEGLDAATYIGCSTNPYYGYDKYEPFRIHQNRVRNQLSFEPQISYHEKLNKAKERCLRENNFEGLTEEEKLHNLAEAQESVKMTEMGYDYKWLETGLKVYEKNLSPMNKGSFKETFEDILNELFQLIHEHESEKDRLNPRIISSLEKNKLWENLIGNLAELMKYCTRSHLQNFDYLWANLEVKLVLLSLDYLVKFHLAPLEMIIKIMRNDNFFFDSLAHCVINTMILGGKSPRERTIFPSWPEELMHSPWTRNLIDLLKGFENDDWKLISHKLTVQSFQNVETTAGTKSSLLKQSKTPNVPFIEAFKQFSSHSFPGEIDSNPRKIVGLVKELIQVSKNQHSNILSFSTYDKTYRLMLTYNMLSYILSYSKLELLELLDQESKSYVVAQRKILRQVIDISQSISDYQYELELHSGILRAFTKLRNPDPQKYDESITKEYSHWLIDLISNKLGYETASVSMEIINPHFESQSLILQRNLKDLGCLIQSTYSKKKSSSKMPLKKPYGLEETKKSLVSTLNSCNKLLYSSIKENLNQILGIKTFRDEWAKSVLKLAETHQYWEEDYSKIKTYYGFTKEYKKKFYY